MTGLRVLVVDDEPQILRALQMKLRGAGYAVETAASAKEALMKAGMRPPEAIILDLLLPDGRGTDEQSAAPHRPGASTLLERFLCSSAIHCRRVPTVISWACA